MNDQTLQLLEKIAAKLGTTVEHLWSVLCRQAIISGITNLLVICVWIASIIWGFKLIIRKTKTPPKTENDKYPCADWCIEAAAGAWSIWGFLVISAILIAGCSLENIVASLLNPEYWALTKILHK